MRSVLLWFSLAVVLLTNSSFQVSYNWQQCGGTNWIGPTECYGGWVCVSVNDFFYQCQPPGSYTNCYAYGSVVTGTVSHDTGKNCIASGSGADQNQGRIYDCNPSSNPNSSCLPTYCRTHPDCSIQNP